MSKNPNSGAAAVKSSSVVLFPQPALQLIYDTAPIGLACLSPDCRYLQINQRLTEICGISVEDHLGRSVRDCVPALAEAVEGIVGSIMQTGDPVTRYRGCRPARRPTRPTVKRAEASLQASEREIRSAEDALLHQRPQGVALMHGTSPYSFDPTHQVRCRNNAH